MFEHYKSPPSSGMVSGEVGQPINPLPIGRWQVTGSSGATRASIVDCTKRRGGGALSDRAVLLHWLYAAIYEFLPLCRGLGKLNVEIGTRLKPYSLYSKTISCLQPVCRKSYVDNLTLSQGNHQPPLIASRSHSWASFVKVTFAASEACGAVGGPSTRDPDRACMYLRTVAWWHVTGSVTSLSDDAPQRPVTLRSILGCWWWWCDSSENSWNGMESLAFVRHGRLVDTLWSIWRECVCVSPGVSNCRLCAMSIVGKK